MIFGVEYDFFSKRIDDDLSKEIKFMVWNNILQDYSHEKIIEALPDVLRKHQKNAPTAAEYEQVIIQRENERKQQISPAQVILRVFNRKLPSVSVIDTDKTREIHSRLIKKVKQFITDYRENENVHNALKKRDDVLEMVQLKDNLVSQGFPIPDDILDEVIG